MSDDGVPVYVSTSWLARRLGLTPSGLETWQRRHVGHCPAHGVWVPSCAGCVFAGAQLAPERDATLLWGGQVLREAPLWLVSRVGEWDAWQERRHRVRGRRRSSGKEET